MPPVLVRFNDILKDRLAEIHGAFQHAISEHDYRGNYCCVYPIKVNQQRQVVEQVLKHGESFGFGLEAGSKPELMAVIAMLDDDRPIICNGFKDAGFIEMALMAQKIGRLVIPVIEKYTELDLILDVAEKLGVRPQIGMRVKLAAKGAGRWQSSGGYRSKFGLTVTEVLRALDHLKSHDMADCFKLLAFPPGQSDHEHSTRQRGAHRGLADLCRSGQARRGARVSGCRWRTGRRLRRFAHEL